MTVLNWPLERKLKFQMSVSIEIKKRYRMIYWWWSFPLHSKLWVCSINISFRTRIKETIDTATSVALIDLYLELARAVILVLEPKANETIWFWNNKFQNLRIISQLQLEMVYTSHVFKNLQLLIRRNKRQ